MLRCGIDLLAEIIDQLRRTATVVDSRWLRDQGVNAPTMEASSAAVFGPSCSAAGTLSAAMVYWICVIATSVSGSGGRRTKIQVIPWARV